MKFLLLFMALGITSLHAEESLLENTYTHLEQDKKIIQKGMKFGHRKKALELLEKRNAKMVELVEQLDIELQKKDEEIAEINREKVCTLTIFRQEFSGVSNNVNAAKEKAYQQCAQKYDLNLQCKRASVKCE